MPEGDTVWRTCRRLQRALAGRVLVMADLRWPGLSTADLTGMTTTEVVARGKHILHRLDSGLTLHSHLRMDGQWRVGATAATTERTLRNPQVRAVVGTEEWTALGLRLGALELVETGHEHMLVGHLGPDLLDPHWDPREAARRLGASGAGIGAALLDQRNLAGMGTLYAAETLFLERLCPWRPAAQLDAAQFAALLERARRLLDLGKEHAAQSTTGVRRPGETTWVHGRTGRACRRCGETVRMAAVGSPPRQRAMCYCPRCQGGLAPADDGRPQPPLGSGRGDHPSAL